MFLSTKPMQKYHNKQSLHLPQILRAHSPAVHATLLYRSLKMSASYFEAGLRIYWKYFLLYNRTHLDV